MLPKMNEKFAAFIAPAHATRNGWGFFGSILFLVLVYAGLVFAIMGIFALAKTPFSDLPLADTFAYVRAGFAKPSNPEDMIGVMATFIGMFVATWLAVRIFGARSIRTLFGPGAVVRNFLSACVIVAPLLAIALAITLYRFDFRENLPLGTWLLWLLPAVVLLLIQVTAEEMVFRGYLMQELAVRFKSRWIWYVLPSALFGCLHFDFGQFGANAMLVVASTSLFGLIAADITIRTGNLGGAIGLHFMNNLMAVMLASLEGRLSGLSLFIIDISVSDHDSLRELLMVEFGFIALLYIIYIGVMHRRERQ